MTFPHHTRARYLSVNGSPANDECLHCIITDAIVRFFEHRKAADTAAVIDYITTVLCEFIAAGDDRNGRRKMIKSVVEVIPKRVADARQQGRHPGGDLHPMGRTPAHGAGPKTPDNGGSK